jgi:hypothetical protein
MRGLPCLGKEQFVNRNYRTRHAGGVPGWGPAPGWGQPLPGWSPLIDRGPLPVRLAGSVTRWWWPILALATFGSVVGFVLGHDHPSPGLSTRGLITIALAALVVVLLTLHRTAGPGALARATADYAVVTVLTALLVLAGGLDQPPSDAATSSAKPTPTAKPSRNAVQDQPAVLRIAATVTNAASKAIRAVTGAAGWLADLWRQADAQTDHPNRSPTTTKPKGEALPSPTSPASTWRPL